MSSVLSCLSQGRSTHLVHHGCLSSPPISILLTSASIRMIFQSVNQILSLLCINVPSDLYHPEDKNRTNSGSNKFVEPGINKICGNAVFTVRKWYFLDLSYNSYYITYFWYYKIKNLIWWLYDVTFCLLYFKQIRQSCFIGDTNEEFTLNCVI